MWIIVSIYNGDIWIYLPAMKCRWLKNPRLNGGLIGKASIMGRRSIAMFDVKWDLTKTNQVHQLTLKLTHICAKKDVTNETSV